MSLRARPSSSIVAITHVPSPRLADALRTFIAVKPIDIDRATLEHEEYRRMLARAGARVVLLATNRAHADGVFVEDTAVVLDEVAVTTSMATASRRDEPRGVEDELRKYRDEIARITLPATLEGGDVLRVGRRLFVGATTRTNVAGMDALETIAKRHGYTVHRVRVRGCLHLKTGMTALPDGTFLVSQGWIDERDLLGLPLVYVDASEPNAANVAVIRERVLAAAAHQRTNERIRELGFDVDAVDLSELAKAEGSVTCLSIFVETRDASA